MSTINKNIEHVLDDLFLDSKNDYLQMMKGMAKSIFRPIQPLDFKDAYLSISREQGEDLKNLIIKNNCQDVVEFGTSFGISTLYLAQGIMETGGRIITTELVESKARQAIQNFKQAGVNHLIEVRIGDALETLKHHKQSIDLLLLDGWKDLYFPLFQLLEPNFHEGTVIYVDNADMGETRAFLQRIKHNPKYRFESKHQGKVVLIRVNE